MLEFLSAQANSPFSIALALVFLLGIFELICMLVGLSVFSTIENWLPLDFDTDIDAPASGMTGLLGWLCLNRLPLLIWFVLALSSFAIAGFVINFLSVQLTSALLPQLITVPIALVLTFILTHYLGNAIANVLPKNETTAVSIDSLVGCVGTITQGKAVKGLPAEALVRDQFQQKHYVLVEPEEADVEFPRGVEVVLLNHKGKIWTAARFG